MAKRFQVSAPRSSKPPALRSPKRASGTALPKAPVEVLPPSDGAPRPTFPIAVEPQTSNAQLAPPPLVDRYPTVVGPRLTYQYVATTSQLATVGYRQQAVDLWRELVEQDPHLGSVLQKRILSVANGKLEVVPAEIDEADGDYQIALDAAQMVREKLARIPNLAQALATLLWAIYYACSAAEIIWSRDADGWNVDRLEFVASRRLAWPDMQSWDAYVWDQGQVFGWNSPWGSTPTNAGVFGLRLSDWPGKFVFFAPQLFADYPTRDGLARQTAMWAVFKREGVRGAVDYLERFAKGFLDLEFSTTDTGNPRAAVKADIEFAKHLGEVLGPGDGRTATHPDSITITPKSFEGGGGGKSKITWAEWIQICNAEISKLVLGGTLGTEVGKGGGNRALGEVQERAEVDLEQFDATALAETLRRDLVTWLVRLNMPEALHLVPSILIHIETEPDAKSVVENALALVNAGAPLDADDVVQKAGFKCVPNAEKITLDGREVPKPRQLFKSDFLDPSQVYSSLLSEEAKRQLQEAADQAHEQAMAKASQPAVPQVPPADQRPANENGAPKSAKASPLRPPKPGSAAAEKDKKLGEERRAFLLSSRRPDKAAAHEVYQELLEDYPASALDWILAGHWEGPQEIRTEDVDFSGADTWRASHEPSEPYMRRIEEGRRKPVVLVKTPNNPKLVIVDGRHRTLASKKLGIPVLAYVAEVHVDRGPWEVLHDAQKKGSSKLGGSVASSRSRGASRPKTRTGATRR
jgi:phage gp29-like protein